MSIPSRCQGEDSENEKGCQRQPSTLSSRPCMRQSLTSNTPSPVVPWSCSLTFLTPHQLQYKTQNHTRHSAFQCRFLRHAPQWGSNLKIYIGHLNTSMNKQRQFLFFSLLYLKIVNANTKVTAQCQCKHLSKQWFKADKLLTTHPFSGWVHMCITIWKLYALASCLLLQKLHTALPCQKSPGYWEGT